MDEAPEWETSTANAPDIRHKQVADEANAPNAARKQAVDEAINMISVLIVAWLL